MSSCVLFGAFWPRVLRGMLNHSRPQVDSEFTFVYNVRKVTAWWKREWPKIRKQFCYYRCHLLATLLWVVSYP